MPARRITALATAFTLSAASLGLWAAGGFSAQAATLPTPDHTVVVVFENHAYSQVVGTSSAPYINSLKSGGANLTAFTPRPIPASPTTSPCSPDRRRASPTTPATRPASARRPTWRRN
ncbi:hypothetical protein GCM10011574_63120 [Microbispora bryophytorum]|uniref:Acid phosphatase n=1 Tax=Microbispora bryophytorum TaxID=1460882 RepID=A0A8H9LGY0_9ACTN|nr:hypothetical protein GCM10011574_63120 [Microbispora bryophytorum]